MKRLLSIGLIALTAIFFMASCKKEKVKPTSEKESGITSTEMANSRNPYDKVGIIHNEFMNYFLGHVNSSTKMNSDKLLAVIQGFYKENGMQYDKKTETNYIRVFNKLSDFKNLNSDAIMEYICKAYPQYCYSKIDLSLPDFSSGNTSTDRALNYIERVKEKEGSIMSDKNINNGVKSIILSSYSVTRYSVAYWHNASTNYLATFMGGTTTTTTNHGHIYVPDLYPPPPPGPWNPGPVLAHMTALPLAFTIITNGNGGTTGGTYNPNDPEQWMTTVAIISVIYEVTFADSDTLPFPLVDWTE